MMRAIDEEFTRHPFYGSRRMKIYLQGLGYEVGRELVSRLMKLMGLEAQYQKPNLSKACPENRVYPYLLRGGYKLLGATRCGAQILPTYR